MQLAILKQPLTSNPGKLMKKYSIYFSILIIIINIIACKDEPSGLGSDLLPSSDKIMLKNFNSSVDSTSISSSSYKKFINTGSIGVLLTGKYKNFDAFSVLKANNISDTLSSYNVVEANLVLYPSYYAIDNKTDQISFTLYKVTTEWSAATLDSIATVVFNYESTPIGEYSGTLIDTVPISIPINLNLIKEWLVIASDTSKKALNQGLILVGNSNNNVIRSFYSANSSTNPPFFNIVLEKNGILDSISFKNIEDAYFVRNNNYVFPPTLLGIQSGIGIRARLKFDLDRIPKYCFINNAMVTVTLDKASSLFGIGHRDSLIASFITDPTLNQSKSQILGIPSSDGETRYTFNLTSFVQEWVNAKPNYGFDIYSIGELESIDVFAIYSQLVSDKNKIPKLTITYFTAPK
jgi:hypothetical protein